MSDARGASTHGRAAPMTEAPGPLGQAVTVRADQATTFEVLVRDIGAWWPVTGFSLGGARVRGVHLEGGAGGLLVERWDDGTQHAWGEVLVWDPPHRLVLSWHVTGVPTEVELRVLALGPGLCRVEVEHRGWEALEPTPAPTVRATYRDGWPVVLGRLRDHVEAH
ncbi:SRPBCC domain-containing protein [Cellulomonas wangsupingiae]|uniref:SRPBCC domain-containing protein n=1 Tax=Cellulomonas wangsupingiae TaxID=2968085 RepID=UPI001D0E097F|nr:SRPBCC domain-containing protein [Cellulomonas wangsupingiae]MCM0638310.1 SRPBCC domain-containing protein [Cellulomonas wangsupingiae]